MSVYGTSIQGYIKCHYEDLREVFGEPYSFGDKVICEWNLESVIGEPATIYCYKEVTVPRGEYLWHIGGNNQKVVTKVYELFDKVAIEYEDVSNLSCALSRSTS